MSSIRDNSSNMLVDFDPKNITHSLLRQEQQHGDGRGGLSVRQPVPGAFLVVPGARCRDPAIPGTIEKSRKWGHMGRRRRPKSPTNRLAFDGRS